MYGRGKVGSFSEANVGLAVDSVGRGVELGRGNVERAVQDSKSPRALPLRTNEGRYKSAATVLFSVGFNAYNSLRKLEEDGSQPAKRATSNLVASLREVLSGQLKNIGNVSVSDVLSSEYNTRTGYINLGVQCSESFKECSLDIDIQERVSCCATVIFMMGMFYGRFLGDAEKGGSQPAEGCTSDQSKVLGGILFSIEARAKYLKALKSQSV